MRTEARIFTSIWRDKDFLGLVPSAQRLYLFLLSQDDMTLCGVVPLRETRWATKADGLTSQSVTADLAILEQAQFVVTDRTSGELLVRSFIRRDGVWKQWPLLESARKAAATVESAALRAVVAEELKRVLAEEDVRGKASQVLAQFMAEITLEIVPGQGPDNSLLDQGDNQGVSKVIAGCLQSAGVRSKELSSNSTEVVREDVRELCAFLADKIEANGSKRPSIGKNWHTACRLLLDADGRSPAQVRKAIEWSQHDEFWRQHILSMPKLREKYDQLRLAAQRNGHGGKPSSNGAAVPAPGVPEHMLRR